MVPPPSRRLRSVPGPESRRTVFYIRISKLGDRHGDAFHSPALQLEAMQRVADARGLLHVATVEDIDKTGRTFAREGVQKVMAMARAGEIDVVAVLNLSRFGRAAGESLRYISDLRDLGVRIVSTTENIDDSPEGQYLLGTFLGMAQLYSDQVGRQWQQVITRRAQQGRFHGSNPPTGYRLLPRAEGGGLIPDPVMAEQVAEAFARYARGHLVSHIARDLADRKGGALAVVTLKQMLRNPVYIGLVSMNGVDYPGLHVPLVERPVWDAVQRRLARDAQTPSRALATAHSLAGLVKCAHCGHSLHLHVEPARPGKTKQDVARLMCRKTISGRKNPCQGVGYPPVGKVEAALLPALAAHLDRLDSGRMDDPVWLNAHGRRKQAGKDITAARKELVKVEAGLLNLTRAHALGDVTKAAYDLTAPDLERQADALRRQVEDSQEVQAAPPPRELVKAGRALLAAWGPLTVSERNRALRMFIVKVEVRRAAVWREGFGCEPGERLNVTWVLG